MKKITLTKLALQRQRNLLIIQNYQLEEEVIKTPFIWSVLTCDCKTKTFFYGIANKRPKYRQNLVQKLGP